MTKIVLKAKNLNQLNKAASIAKEIGLEEKKDFFFIMDACRTELERETSNGTITVLGFRPLPADIADKIGKKFQLYK